jgi:beta-N-acetylglucosaminidase
VWKNQLFIENLVDRDTLQNSAAEEKINTFYMISHNAIGTGEEICSPEYEQSPYS